MNQKQDGHAWGLAKWRKAQVSYIFNIKAFKEAQPGELLETVPSRGVANG